MKIPVIVELTHKICKIYIIIHDKYYGEKHNKKWRRGGTVLKKGERKRH